MNTEVKSKWIDALRSGEYEQGRGQLREDIGVGGVSVSKFCCLGVLCDLAVEEGVIPEPVFREEDRVMQYVYGGSTGGGSWSYLPRKVLHWADLTEANPHVRIFKDGLECNYQLSVLNDGDTGVDYTFEEIAGFIEEQL